MSAESSDPRAPSTPPGTRARLTGLGSVFGKGIRDSRRVILFAGVGLGLLSLFSAAQLAASFDTPAARALLASQMADLPAVFKGILGEPIDLSTLGGFLSWRLLPFFALALGAWSIGAMANTLAGETRRGSLELLLAAPISRRIDRHREGPRARGGDDHRGAHRGAPDVAWHRRVRQDGDRCGRPGRGPRASSHGSRRSLSRAGRRPSRRRRWWVAHALRVSGRSCSSAATSSMDMGRWCRLLDVLRPLSLHAWTSAQRPMAGSWDLLPVGLVVLLAVVLIGVGVLAFERRDLGAAERGRDTAVPRACRRWAPASADRRHVPSRIGHRWPSRGPSAWVCTACSSPSRPTPSASS